MAVKESHMARDEQYLLYPMDTGEAATAAASPLVAPAQQQPSG